MESGAIEVLERRVLWALVVGSSRHMPGSESLLWTSFLTALHCGNVSDPKNSLSKMWHARDGLEPSTQVEALAVLSTCCRDLADFNINLRDQLLATREGPPLQLRRGVHRSATLIALLAFNYLGQAAFSSSFALSGLLSLLSEVSDMAEYLGDHELAQLLKKLHRAHARTKLSPLISEFTAHLRTQRDTDAPVRLSLEKGKPSLHVTPAGPLRQANAVFSAEAQPWNPSSCSDSVGNALAEVVRKAGDSAKEAFLSVVAH